MRGGEAVHEVGAVGLHFLHEVAAREPQEERLWSVVGLDQFLRGLWEMVTTSLRLALWPWPSFVQGLPETLPTGKGLNRHQNPASCPNIPSWAVYCSLDMSPRYSWTANPELPPPGSLPRSNAYQLGSHSTNPVPPLCACLILLLPQRPVPLPASLSALQGQGGSHLSQGLEQPPATLGLCLAWVVRPWSLMPCIGCPLLGMTIALELLETPGRGLVPWVHLLPS